MRTERSGTSTSVASKIATMLLLSFVLSTATQVAADPEAAGSMPPISVPVTAEQPIHIDACAVRGPKSGWLSLSFTNEANQEVDEVRLRVTFRGVTRLVVDVGRFAHGVTIKREYPYEFEAPPHREAALCNIVSVRYADGTTWTPSSTNAT